MSNISKYQDTNDLKIVYYLGAGASYNSVPIQEKLGFFMTEVANQIKTSCNQSIVDVSNRERQLKINKERRVLEKVANDIEYFGKMASEYGSLDIYARRLHLLGLDSELNRLKFSASIYFVIWENFIFKKQKLDSNNYYQHIDKRYLALLSVLLEKGKGINPSLNKNVTFISWNYDLQIEKAYQSFMDKKANDITLVNNSFTYLNHDYPNMKRDIIHLNGLSGLFDDNGKDISVLENNNFKNLEDFLVNLLDNINDFKQHESRFKKYIQYAWENNSNRELAKKVMSEADVLIIIGYSFPAFNRLIDAELMKSFKEGKGLTQVVYQDPNASEDIMNSFFGENNKNVVINRDLPKQFHIPHEFLNPEAPFDKFFGF